MRTKGKARGPAGKTGVVFRNPVLPGFYPDPSVCRVGKDFYLATSSFEYFPAIPIFHSRDLIHWRQLGHAIDRKSQLDFSRIPSSQGIYAPTLRYHRGIFYLVTTCAGGRGNFFMTAKQPAGRWSDPVGLDGDGIDPDLFFDDDGTAYYTRNGPAEERDYPKIVQARLDVKRGKLLEEPYELFRGTGGIWPEAPHLYKVGQTYYLVIAEGGTSYGHSVVVARSDSPTGPFKGYPNNPVLTHRHRKRHPVQAIGHADLVELEDGNWWSLLLGIRPTAGRYHHLGREVFLAPVEWTGDGWPIVGAGEAVELQMQAPALKARPWKRPSARDHFLAPELRVEYCFLRRPNTRNFSLNERASHLRLWGSRVTLDDVASPSLILRRQQHVNATTRASLQFEPRRIGEQAGLTVRANEDNRYDLLVQKGVSGLEALLVRRVEGQQRVVGRMDLDASRVQLRVDASPSHYEFTIQCGAREETLGRLSTRALSSEVIGQRGALHFTGVMFGLFAVGAGRRCSVPADFDWWEYRQSAGA